jgi:hypothetical protein
LRAVAVVVTLIVLIIGVRENTDIVRASAHSNNLQSLSDLQTTILSNPDAVRVYTSFINNDILILDDEDRTRLTLIFLSTFRAYEAAYFSERYGLLGEEEWRRFEDSICFFFRRAQSGGFEAPIRDTLTDEFIRHVEGRCLG